MKIERINENQIRCILNKQDLRERNLQLSEFVYGSDKARELFSDMMRKASDECDFEAEDTPLMVEAIPTSQESLMLVITKINNPEELDTRFSSFTPYHEDENTEESTETEETVSPFGSKSLEHLQQLAGDLLDHVLQARMDSKKEADVKVEEEAPVKETALSPKAFTFRNFMELTAYAKAVKRFDAGLSTLYKDTVSNAYVLYLASIDASPADFGKACNIACEYGAAMELAANAYYEEHFRLLMKNDALRQLAEV